PLASNGTSQNGPVTKQYFDQLNREVRTETEGFDGTISSVKTQYNGLGQVLQKSLPYKPSDTVQWTQYQYDAIGRPTLEIAPDDATSTSRTSYAYNVGGNPLASSVTRLSVAGNQTRTTVKNSQGQVASVT